MNALWTPAIIPIVLGAIAYLLLQKGVIGSRGFLLSGIACIGLSVILALRFTPATFESAILSTFSIVAIAGGFGFLVAREPVYAALGFATAVLSTCGLLFMESALFIAAATMIVYAGATIIIFLFVLMFAQKSELSAYDLNLTNPILASIIGVIVLSTIVISVTGENEISPVREDVTRKLSSVRPPLTTPESATTEGQTTTSDSKSNNQIASITTAGLGRSLYTDYILSVELAGAVLLVATIGAIALAQKTPETSV